ncbi:MAG: hypothetical protein LBK75_00640 [Oscillospiraceae bacterium]|jgi:predicted GH43/DUF377 family glycosyl hydrolase|nr:hypothetical protein [Oscillospiraceae bacterium]
MNAYVHMHGNARKTCWRTALSLLLALVYLTGLLAATPIAAQAPEGLDDLSTTDGSKPYPAAVASYCNTQGGLDKTAALTDGVIAYTEGVEGGGAVHNRWTNYGHTDATTDWVGVQFGVTQLVSAVDLEVYIDPNIPQITNPAMAPPVSIAVTYKNDRGDFVPVTGVTASPAVPAAYLNTLTFDAVLTREIRVTLERPSGKYVGLTEMTVYGKRLAAYDEAEVNLALVSGGTTVTASHFYSAGDSPQSAADGVVSYTDASPRSRWALWSHRGTAEWIDFHFGKTARVNRAEIYVFTDKPSPSNTVEPASITVQYYADGTWKEAEVFHQVPAAPVGANLNGAGGQNVIAFREVVTDQIRLNVQLKEGKSAALTEVEIFGRYTEDAPPAEIPSTEGLDNLALNTADVGYPQVFVSIQPDPATDSAARLVDGVISGLQNLSGYDTGPRSRWTSYNNPGVISTIGSRFAVPQTTEIVDLYVYNDGGGCKLPSAVQLEYYDDAAEAWAPVTLTFAREDKTAVFEHPYSAGKIFRYLYAFEPVVTTSVRVRLTPASGASLAVSELQIWGVEIYQNGHKLSVPASLSTTAGESAPTASVGVKLQAPAPDGGRTVYVRATDAAQNTAAVSVTVPAGVRERAFDISLAGLTAGAVTIESSLDADFADANVCAARLVVYVPQSVVDDIYEEVKTPYEYGVILRPGQVGDIDSNVVDNPLPFRIPGDEDHVYMTYVAHDGVGYQTGLARSADFVTWEKLGTVIDNRNVQTWDRYNAAGYIVRDHEWGKAPYPHVVPADNEGPFAGKYVMSYLASDTAGYEAGVKRGGMAYTDRLLDEDGSPVLWTRWPDPVLVPTHSYEKNIIWKSIVVYDSEKKQYEILYNCASGPEIIAQAYSTDLIHWTKEEDNPTVAAEVHDGYNWGNTHSADPDVVKIGDYWVMFYFTTTPGGIVDSYAVSTDMIHWTKSFKILTPRNGTWSSTYAHKPGVIKQNGVVYHYYCAVGSQGRVNAVNTSVDLSVVRRAQAVTEADFAEASQYKLVQSALANLQYELRREDGSLERVLAARALLTEALAPEAGGTLIQTELTLTRRTGEADAVFAASATVGSAADGPQTVSVLLAIYDGAGRLTGVASHTESVAPGALCELTAELDTAGRDTALVKAFLWKGIVPVCPAVVYQAA